MRFRRRGFGLLAGTCEVKVKSSHLREVEHEGTTLKVTFQNGKVYHGRCSPLVYAGLLAAKSKGKYFHKFIAPHWRGKVVENG